MLSTASRGLRAVAQHLPALCTQRGSLIGTGRWFSAAQAEPLAGEAPLAGRIALVSMRHLGVQVVRRLISVAEGTPTGRQPLPPAFFAITAMNEPPMPAAGEEVIEKKGIQLRGAPMYLDMQVAHSERARRIQTKYFRSSRCRCPMQATTPLDPRVVDVMLPFMTEQYGNPHSRTHLYGWEAEDAVEVARAQVDGHICLGGLNHCMISALISLANGARADSHGGRWQA